MCLIDCSKWSSVHCTGAELPTITVPTKREVRIKNLVEVSRQVLDKAAEDRFSRNRAQWIILLHNVNKLIQNTAVFKTVKIDIFHFKKFAIFLLFLLKNGSWVHVRTTSMIYDLEQK